MKKSTYLFQQSQHAALKCGAAAVIFIAAVVYGVFCCFCQSGLGVAACWIVALVSLCCAVVFGNRSSDHMSRALDAEKSGR